MKSEQLFNTYKEIIKKSLKGVRFNDIKPYGNEFITYMGDMKVIGGTFDIQLVGKHLENGIDYIGFQADFLEPTTYDENGIPTEHHTTIGICTATIKDNKVIKSNFNELESKLQVINYYINNQIAQELQDICNEYEFKYKKLANQEIALCAKNTNNKWQEWIKFDLDKRNISIIGNTDNCNIWFCDTRKDMNPTKITSFVGKLNHLFRRFNTSVKIKTLIDPEDWQQIAGVEDAYEDNYYDIKFHDIEFGADNYIYFTVEQGEYGLDGLFRIHDPANGPDMELVRLDNCCMEEDINFADAHWSEMEEKLCEIARQREEKMEKNNQDNSEEDSEEVL